MPDLIDRQAVLEALETAYNGGGMRYETYSGMFDEIDNMPNRASEWISVEDRLPEVPEKTYSTNTWVIAHVEGHQNSCCRVYERAVLKRGVVYRWLYPWGGISDEKIFHWQPFPEPPEEIET